MVASFPVLFALAVSPTLCVLGIVQILAVVAAGAARVAEGTRHERFGQWLCLGGLTVVGTLCGAAIRIGPNAAAASAVTLALVTMISVADFSPRR